MKNWIETHGARLFGVTTLTPRKHDAADFYDIHVTTLRGALEAAYTAGRDARSAELASNGGRATSPRKARTSKRNGKAGGRPVGIPNVCPTCKAGYRSLTHAVTCKGGAV
jgi:hypothetical protein